MGIKSNGLRFCVLLFGSQKPLWWEIAWGIFPEPIHYLDRFTGTFELHASWQYRGMKMDSAGMLISVTGFSQMMCCRHGLCLKICLLLRILLAS